MRRRRVLQQPAWRGCGQSMRLVATLELCSKADTCLIIPSPPPSPPSSLWQRYGKVHTIVGHDGPEMEYSYNGYTFLTSVLDGVGGQRHAPTTFPLGKTRYPLHRRLGGPQVWSGWVRKISPPTGIRSLDRPASSKLLYWLSYSGPALHYGTKKSFKIQNYYKSTKNIYCELYLTSHFLLRSKYNAY